MRLFVILTVVVSVAGCSKYAVDRIDVSGEAQLLNYHACFDRKCEEIDPFVTRQEIVLGESSFSFGIEHCMVTRVFESGGVVYPIVMNNFSTFLCLLCPDGEIVYLADIREVQGRKIQGFDVRTERDELQIALSYSDYQQLDSTRELKITLSMGSTFERCYCKTTVTGE